MVLAVAACTINPPVQEMSNARQTIQAAKEAGAETHAPDTLAAAQRLLDSAARKLQQGDYHVARNFALEAQQQAMFARQQALNKMGMPRQNQ